MTDLESRLAHTERQVRRWRAVTVATVPLCAAALLLRPLLPGPPPPPAPAAAEFITLSAKHLKVELLEVRDEQGNRVATLSSGAGGGSLMINSATPKDHVVTITADRFGADVTVSLQRPPRQFGHLRIMDGKPYLQMEEGGDKTFRKFWQAPLYSDDGNIAEPFSFTSATARRGPPPSAQPDR